MYWINVLELKVDFIGVKRFYVLEVIVILCILYEDIIS